MNKARCSSDSLAPAVADRLLSREVTDVAWGIEIEDVREGYARIAMRVRKDMLNGHETAHGGMVFALADTAFAYACNSRNISTVAQQASIVFLAPAHEGDRLTAEAEEEAVVGRSGVYVVKSATRMAKISRLFMVFRVPSGEKFCLLRTTN
ncbi:MAG TPA: hydroxyphenylacetyl-CoA thioesterase PaaI [Rhizomicrobium sp.]